MRERVFDRPPPHPRKLALTGGGLVDVGSGQPRAMISCAVNAAMIAMPHSSDRKISLRVLTAAEGTGPWGYDPSPMPSDPPAAEPSSSEHLVVVGQGYVGLPLAMRAVDVGFRVTGLDLDDTRIAGLAAGTSHVEDVADEVVDAALASGRYHPTADTADLAGFDIAVISVPTPLTDGAPDLSYVTAAARTVAGALEAGACVVLESTTYPGTTAELVAPILEEATGLTAGVDFDLGYSPERIDPGNPTWGLVETPKVVSGVTPASLARVRAFYDRIVTTTVPVGDTGTAELTKLLENTFRHVNIALVNELAVFAHELGIDVWAAVDAAATKPFGFMPFRPGPGVGGHCLPIDPSYLSWQVHRSTGRNFRFVELANDVNEQMPSYVVERIVEHLNRRDLPVRGRTVLLLGMSYKRNTGDARETPSAPIAELLAERGATVWATDPHVDPAELPPSVTARPFDAETIEAADLVVVLVDHDAFDRDLVRSHATHVLDCRRWLGSADDVEVL